MRELAGVGYAVGSIVEQEAVGRLATVRLTLSSAPRAPVLDLLFAPSGIEPEVVAAAETVEVLPRLTIPVASTGHLIALNALSRDDARRPPDPVDLPNAARGSLRCGCGVGASRRRPDLHEGLRPGPRLAGGVELSADALKASPGYWGDSMTGGALRRFWTLPESACGRGSTTW